MVYNLKNIRDKKGSTIVELMIVVVLIVVLIPAAVNAFVSARKINGQSYIQHQGAVTLGETGDILRYLRNQGFDLLVNGDFYLIRNPGTGSWLVKSDLPNIDTYERHITVSNALRHQDTKDLYLPGDIGASYEDPDTKKIIMEIIWSPDYVSANLISQTVYITNWQKIFTY